MQFHAKPPGRRVEAIVSWLDWYFSVPPFQFEIIPGIVSISIPAISNSKLVSWVSAIDCGLWCVQPAVNLINSSRCSIDLSVSSLPIVCGVGLINFGDKGIRTYKAQHLNLLYRSMWKALWSFSFFMVYGATYNTVASYRIMWTSSVSTWVDEVEREKTSTGNCVSNITIPLSLHNYCIYLIHLWPRSWLLMVGRSFSLSLCICWYVCFQALLFHLPVMWLFVSIAGDIGRFWLANQVRFYSAQS